MYLKVRRLDGKPGDEDVIINISKIACIQDIRKILFEKINVPMDKQNLYYKGKQLIDDHRVMDYDIQLNDVIQLMIRTSMAEEEKGTCTKFEKIEKTTSEESLERCFSKYYKRGDALDVIVEAHGAWFEAKLLDIFLKPGDVDEGCNEMHLLYRVELEDGKECHNLNFDEIRPRAYRSLKKSDLTVGQCVLVNYNLEDPSTRGFWFDFTVRSINRTNIVGCISVGRERTPIDESILKCFDDILKVEKPTLLSCRPKNLPTNIPLRKNHFYCEVCKDVAVKPCADCGCSVCSGKNDADTIILCDECNFGYHIKCLTPPLEEVPSDPDWYCPSCKVDENEIVKAGDKLKFSKKKSKMVSSNKEGTSRDWGQGMACVGRTKECTIVPKDHYGPVPGVEVGTCWKFRLQASEAGIHRPHVAGIHGRESDGAYSLVLSGGYEDDIDNGNEFLYSGSGGRDLSGNKRVSDQSCDQTLTRMNKALALNCNVPLNKNGGEAVNWKGGKPVRVVRNYKLSKHSKYAPKDGNRYDGIYKVVKYYPETGKSGFLVWRYLLRRDDPTPAPWSKDGQEFEMKYPAGFLEAQAAKELSSNKENQKGTKRRASRANGQGGSKKQKVTQYKLGEDITNTILEDEMNKKSWDECKALLKDGQQAFLSKIEEIFMCVCCQELTYLPITTECKHNVCKSCLRRSFSTAVYSCPNCRFELGPDCEMPINEKLSKVLLALFPGYESGR